MKKILLINPSAHAARKKPDIQMDHEKKVNLGLEPTVPLGIVCLGTYLKEHGYAITLIDSRLYTPEVFYARLQNALEEGVFLVGVSVMTSCIAETLDVLRYVKKYDPAITTVLGGIHASLFPEQTARHELVDFVVFGEGERPLKALVEKICAKDPAYETIDNLCFTRNGQTVFHKQVSFVDINELPLPDYDLVDIEAYVTRQFKDGRWGRMLEYQSSRGCPSRCAFCVNTLVNERRWRQRDPQHVVDELTFLVERYKLDHVFFLDESFFPNKKNVRVIVDGLHKLPITWEANTRADYFNGTYITDEFMADLAQSGLRVNRMGIESGSARTLEHLKKDITKEQIINAVTISTKNRVLTMTAFMIGLPAETRDDMIETMDIIHEMESIGGDFLVIIGPQIFRPYPGGELYEECKRGGFQEPASLDEWAEFTATGAAYISNFSWVEDKDFAQMMILLRSIAQDKKTASRHMPPLKKIAREFFYPFVRFRVNNCFYRGLIDMRLAYFLKRFSMKRAMKTRQEPVLRVLPDCCDSLER